jgi:hypothetical protein
VGAGNADALPALFSWRQMLVVIVILRVETKHESARNSLLPLKA